MQQTNLSRATRFRIASVIAGITQAEFGARYGVTAQCVNRILLEQARSRRIEQAIDDFCDEQFRKLNYRLPRAA